MHHSRFISPTTVSPHGGDGWKWRLLVLAGAEDLLLLEVSEGVMQTGCERVLWVGRR